MFTLDTSKPSEEKKRPFDLERYLETSVVPKICELFDSWSGFLEEDMTRAEGSAEDPEDMARTARRDSSLVRHGIEHDLQENLPKIFGQEITGRVLKAFREL